jgi:hypothetical protein
LQWILQCDSHLLAHDSRLCQAAAREGEEKFNKVDIFCHTTVIFVKLLPARAKKKFNKVGFVSLELVFFGRLVIPCGGLFRHDSGCCHV